MTRREGRVWKETAPEQKNAGRKNEVNRGLIAIFLPRVFPFPLSGFADNFSRRTRL